MSVQCILNHPENGFSAVLLFVKIEYLRAFLRELRVRAHTYPDHRSSV